jgi:excinuclease UvrABC ATPase subunit
MVDHEPSAGHDWIIDIGSEGGSKGGRVMFGSTPGQLRMAKRCAERVSI